MRNRSVKNTCKNRTNSFFIENKGQWPEEVLFLASKNGLNTFITKSGLVMDVYRIKDNKEKNTKPILPEHKTGDLHAATRSGQVIQLEFENALTAPQPQG